MAADDTDGLMSYLQQSDPTLSDEGAQALAALHTKYGLPTPLAGGTGPAPASDAAPAQSESEDEDSESAPAESSPQSGPPTSLLDTLFGSTPKAAPASYNPEDRAAIIAKNAQDSSGTNWLAGLASLGAGLQGKDAGAAGQAFLKMQQDQRDNKLTSFDKNRQAILDQGKEAREMDPNSDESKLAQSLASKLMPGKDFSQLPASKITALLPTIKGFYDVEQKHLDRQEKTAELGNARADRLATKGTDAQNKILNATQQLAEQMRGSPAVAQAEKDIYSAQKVNSLADQFKNPSPAMVKLLASEVSKIANGGTASMEELKGLTPSTFSGDLAKKVEYFTNSPTPANAQDFVKQLSGYTNAVAKDAQKVIKDRYTRIIDPRRAQLGTDNAAALDAQYTNRFDKDNQASNNAALAAKPKTVTQNGHTYNLNPQTGQYE